MDSAMPLAAHYAALAHQLAEEERWPTSGTSAEALAALALRYLPLASSDGQVRAALANIRSDHAIVEPMRTMGRCEEAQEWAHWTSQARAILRHAGLDWCHDGAVDLDDLAQIALLELIRSLPSYRYGSRFSTWAYQVITRGVQRHLRNMAAQKRCGAIERKTDPLAFEGAIAEHEQPEAQASGRLLEQEVEAALVAALGARNAYVFRLWACRDLSAEMIGAHVKLSPARIHAIIAQARSYLRSHETICSWREAARR